MTPNCLDLAIKFSKNEVSAKDFSSDFVKLFQIDRDTGVLGEFSQNEMLTTIFCAVDCHVQNNAPGFEYAISDKNLHTFVNHLVRAYEMGRDISMACEEAYQLLNGER